MLAACGGSDETPAPTVAPSPTAEPTALPATAAPTATEPPPATATAAPDAPTPTASPVATDTPAPTAAPTAAPDLAGLKLELQMVAEGLRQPVFAGHAGDGSGRIFVVEQAGRIVALEADGAEAGSFLDIRQRVGSDANEQGLLGLAFDPDFAANGRLFVYYTDRRGDTVISRFQANEERTEADPDSEVVLVTQEQPAQNHNGGMLAFGPDGYLYAGLGDGGGGGDEFGNGQKLATILATLIRLDVSGDEAAAPADNPFVGQDGARPEIWAWGLRNPWRFSFDRATGDLWIADVGQGEWEEVNFQPAGSPGGENYGWPITEGAHCYEADSCDTDGLTAPVAEYSHNDGGCSITGGYVYRGAAQPALNGVYLYGDYCSGIVWGTAGDGEEWQNAQLLSSDVQISSFGETEAGEVLLVSHGGEIYRLVSQ